MDKLKWWREARFGMFIHWGLYCVPAGKYHGKDYPGIGEWIMHQARIPRSEYARYAEELTAEHFDADQWVKLAKDAGMKYLCITTKHHDGFAMYDSTCSDYTIVKKTPFARDPMKDLAEACHKYGIVLCFYYSQAQDWEQKNGLGNTWDFGPDSEKNFDQYMYDKVLPQLTELLTGYGPIGIIWFDTPMTMTPRQSQIIAEHVRKLQPDCLVSGRIGNGVNDYKSSGDNAIPLLPVEDDWECPATLNDTWGFKTEDHNWKDPATLLRLMIEIISKNGNYLLNVGPDKHGVIPQPSIDILQKVGKWMQVNGESVYGAGPAPLPAYEMPDVKLTHKPGKLYLHVFREPKRTGRILLRNFKINIKKAYLLENPECTLEFADNYTPSMKTNTVIITLPEDFSVDMDTVICLDYEGEIEVSPF